MKNNVARFLRDGMSGLVNMMTGAGTSRDPNSHAQFVYRKPGGQTLEAAYRANWIAGKIVRIPIDDLLREGWRWQADDPLITQLEAEENRLNMRQVLRSCLIRDAIYGGSAFYVGTEDGDTSQELRVERMGKGSIKYLTPFHSQDLQVVELSRDPMNLGQPTMFRVTMGDQPEMMIHPSRVFTFRSRPVERPLSLMNTEDWWGDSRLSNVLADITGASGALTGGARLMSELAVWIYKVSDLADTLASEGGEAQVHKLLNLSMTMKSSLNALAVDSEDDVEIVTANLAGMSEAIRSFMQNVAGAADIPYTRFMAASPDGMNATGDSDVRNYYDRLVGDRGNYIEPQFGRFDQLLIRSATGKYDDKIYRVWNPLWQMTEKEQADLDKSKMEMLGKMLTDGLVHDHVIEQVTRVTMIESPTFPGAEEAFEEAESIKDKRDEVEEDATAIQAPPAKEKPKLRVVKDMEPAPLYVRRDVKNADEILAWAKEQGVPNLFAAAELHVTLLYSKTPVDWMEMGSWNPAEEMVINAGGPRAVSVFGQGALVLEFYDQDLTWRHESMINRGASSDHDKYRSHVTVSNDVGDFDYRLVEPYRGRIVLGPEIFEPIDDEWRDKLSKDELVIDKFNEGKVSRHPAGTGKGGQFAPKGKAGAGGGHAAAYTNALKEFKAVQAKYATEQSVNGKPTPETVKALVEANAKKKQALKDYYANKGSKAAAKADPTPEKPKGLSAEERQAGIDAVKKEKGQALKEYKAHPTGSAEKKAALAEYNKKAAEQKKMEAGLEAYKAKLTGSANQADVTQSKVSAKPLSGMDKAKALQAKHDAAIDAVVKNHPHPTFGKKEVDAVIDKGLAGKTLGYNEQQLFNTYQKELGITPKPASSYAAKAKHPSHSQIVKLDVESGFKDLDSSPAMKKAMDNYLAAVQSKGKYGSSNEHQAYITALSKHIGADLAVPHLPQSAYAGFKDKMTSTELSSMKAYTGNAYSSINSALRNGTDPSSSVKAHIKNMDAAFKKTSAEKDFVLMRGLAPAAIAKYEKAGNFKVGATMIDKGYVSATSSHSTAEGFSQGGYHMVVRVKKGQSIAAAKSFSNYSGENEFILPRNTAFQIHHIDKTAKIVVVDVM